MNASRIISTVLTSALLTALLTGCGADAKSNNAPVVTITEDAITTTAPPDATEATSTEPQSDIQLAVETFTSALDDLGIEHTEPVRSEVGLSGASASFDLTINGYDAGILVFPDTEGLKTWQEASDAFGGIHVAVKNSVLSLNSGDGISDSAEIAPLIADAVGGEARGV